MIYVRLCFPPFSGLNWESTWRRLRLVLVCGDDSDNSRHVYHVNLSLCLCPHKESYLWVHSISGYSGTSWWFWCQFWMLHTAFLGFLLGATLSQLYTAIYFQRWHWRYVISTLSQIQTGWQQWHWCHKYCQLDMLSHSSGSWELLWPSGWEVGSLLPSSWCTDWVDRRDKWTSSVSSKRHTRWMKFKNSGRWNQNKMWKEAPRRINNWTLQVLVILFLKT